jgi:hypothetical protein
MVKRLPYRSRHCFKYVKGHLQNAYVCAALGRPTLGGSPRMADRPISLTQARLSAGHLQYATFVGSAATAWLEIRQPGSAVQSSHESLAPERCPWTGTLQAYRQQLRRAGGRWAMHVLHRSIAESAGICVAPQTRDLSSGRCSCDRRLRCPQPDRRSCRASWLSAISKGNIRPGHFRSPSWCTLTLQPVQEGREW